MGRRKRRLSSGIASAGDDPYLFILRKDITEGQNNRQHPSLISEKQVKSLINVDISIPGERVKRPGCTLIEDLGANACTGSFGFDPQGGTSALLVSEGTNLKKWLGFGAFASVYTSFTSSLPTKMIKAFKTGTGDVCLVFNGTDNWLQVDQSFATTDLGSTSGTGSDSPPKSTVATSYRNRVWVLYRDQLYYSDASPSDFSTAFDTVTQVYRIPVGEERALLGTRDLGLLIGGKEQIWALNPSTVPAATDKPEKLLDYGVASGDTFQQVGDDYLFMSFDGVRALKRTIQDKLQIGQSFPLSFPLKTEFSTINWTYIKKACAVYWDNKYFIALPTGASTYNNQVWVYYPASNGWMVLNGWNVSSWAKYKVNGEERLYFTEASADGKVYRAWYGATDNGTAIAMSEEGRNEDMGQPLVKKHSGELKVVAKPGGNYDIDVYGSFDNGSYNFLGHLNVAGSLITFPVTYPVTFYPDQLSYKKFHLDSYGSWYQFRYKLAHSDATTNYDDITIYETSLTANVDEYISEEQA